jgi:hypothetical protein
MALSETLCHAPVGRDYGPRSMVMWTYSTTFFNRTIIHKFQKITGTLDFGKNNPDLFQNDVLVPIILHIGPCVKFL